MILSKKNILFILFLSSLNFQANATNVTQVIPFDSDKWEISDKKAQIIDYLGQKSLLLNGGAAIVKDSNFTNGIIEYDIAFDSTRNFSGVAWRWQDAKNYENFFMRAHKSGMTDANQYTPIFNGQSSWQLYHGEGYNAPVDYVFNEWMHVKLVVSGDVAEVYIRNMEKPALVINDLKHEIKAGKLGLTVLGFKGKNKPTYFSNFSYTEIDKPTLTATSTSPKNPLVGTIMSWSVSDTFDEKSLDGKILLNQEDKKKRNWKNLDSESTGLANIARIQGNEKGKNCVFARIILASDKEQTKLLQFGFSDKVKVYLNDQLIYRGNNTYRTRDYRFLGTIGLFDGLYLPLKKGENEITFAVSELFGGWGLMGKFSNIEGISIKK